MSDYFKRTWEFLKWHKKKFIALGVVGAASVGGYYYAKRMVLDGMRQVEELGRGFQEKFMETQHRKSELLRIRSECSRMILTFIPPLRSMVKQLTDPKPVTEKLKNVRLRIKNSVASSPVEEEEVQQLWDELKVVSLTRLLASIYTLALLNNLLRVQLHILGRYSFEESSEFRREVSQLSLDAQKRGIEDAITEEISPEHTKITRKVRERFLFAGSDHLMNTGDGMKVLVKHIHDCISFGTKDWLMGTDATVTRQDILKMVVSIREAIEKGSVACQDSNTENIGLSTQSRNWLISCLIPSDEEAMLEPDRELNDEQNSLLRQMLEETLDMIESPNFAQSLEITFSKLFAVLYSQIEAKEFEVYHKNKNTPSAESQEEFMLTKVIVSLKVFSGQVLLDGKATQGDEEENQYQQALNDIPELNSFCDEIFEQGVDDSASPLDDLGLGDLGLGDEDIKSIVGLLGGLGGGGDANADPMQLLKLLGDGFGADPQGAAGPGAGSEQQLMQMLQALEAGSPGTSAQQ
uniref:Peroxisomal biogenesis factor 3 n=1 Tax=Mucochytrium quahogii TaxID=96639 RepID=A0A7S2SEF3_9STRA|mmetsp:Transcript_2691/g.3853  ORF Transcript_2691/g.3853 Transcript_2691/m.3853 type:complete len:521 (-) Transcript_2691:675-2237(-)